jgi:hypothetical protein
MCQKDFPFGRRDLVHMGTNAPFTNHAFVLFLSNNYVIDESYALARKHEKKRAKSTIFRHAYCSTCSRWWRRYRSSRCIFLSKIKLIYLYLSSRGILVVCLMCVFNGNATLLWVRTRKRNPGKKGYQTKQFTSCQWKRRSHISYFKIWSFLELKQSVRPPCRCPSSP